MINLKAVIALLVAGSITSLSFAADIETRKQRIASNVDKRIAILQTFKSCVQGSTTKEAIKACRVTKRAAMKDLKNSNKN